MKIKFGLGLDGAAWSSQGSLGSIVAGPKAMTDVLSTRLGIRRPVSTPLDRTIAMEKSLKDILRPGMWAYQSFSVDPYGVASQLLDWRDELVAAGLDLKDPRLAEGSQRLQLLHHVELHQKLLPGESDLLSDVAQTLSQRLEQHWPLGIEDVISLEPISSMPWIWQKILQQLGAHEDCVELKTISDLPELEIISGDHEYAVADVVVGEIKGTEEPLQLLVGGPTDTLDAELRRAGLPSIGVGEYSLGGDQVLGSFVQLVTADDPVPALVDLLTLRVAGQRIWPDSINKFLVRALMRNYGCGAEWHRALEELADNEDYAQAVAFFSTYIWDSPLRLVSSEDLYDAEALATACDAFAEQLNGQAFSADRAAVTSLATVLREDYSSGISDREIHQLLAEVGGNTPSPVSLALANPNLDVIYDPAHIIPGSQVLWWRATAEKTAAADTFSQSELALIQEIAGAGSIPVVLSAKVFSELQGATRLAALAQARRVIAVCPQQLAGEKLVVEHPLLDQLSALIRRRGLPEPRWVSAEEVLADSLSVVPGAHAPRRPDLRGVEFQPGTQLLPENLSYSQLSTLLAAPIEWVIEKAMGIETGVRDHLASGNAMIGTLLQRVVELAITTKRYTAEDLGEFFDQAQTEVAFSLGTRESEARKAEIKQLCVESIFQFFETLKKENAVPVAAEYPLCQEDKAKPLTVPLRDPETGEELPDHWVIDRINGFVDVLAEYPDGELGIFDTKYTTSARRYPEMVENLADADVHSALQLAVYARNFPIDKEIRRTGFWIFRQKELLCPENNDSNDRLWERALVTLGKRLEMLRRGKFEDQLYQQLVDHRESGESLDVNAMKKICNSERDVEIEHGGFIPEGGQYRHYDVLTGLKGEYDV